MRTEDVGSRRAVRDPFKKKNWKLELWSWTKTFMIVFIIAIMIRGFMFTNYIVYGQSMMPTINDGERIIVNKIGYEISQPNRFDLIIFHATEDTDYIKRVIGLPGDTIRYENDILYINDKPHDEDFLNQFREELNGDILTSDFTLEDITGELNVPEGHIFVLGDNRQNSIDSRQIGFVPMEQIVGRANMAYWPIQAFRLF
ncbi:signal peptidase I [Alteribacter aurantiacus]|uniref:signal peptidase I n=1 Tax=Alteribacter aurantiacus TaxID=254410 RepID=UPI00040F5A3E|nr:signal peptidase I [Alteribacter aurantiacus]